MDVEYSAGLLDADLNINPNHNRKKHMLRGLAVGLVVGLGVAAIVAVVMVGELNKAADTDASSFNAGQTDNAASMVGDHTYEAEFRAYMEKHGKSYADKAEYERRYQIFVENLQFIKGHNSAGSSYQVGLNHYSDMTFEEFKTSKLGFAAAAFKPQEGDVVFDVDTEAEVAPHLLGAEQGKQSIPKHVDWREHGLVTPVKNQKQCGSCWSFSTTGVLEGAYMKSHGGKVSLSEQQLVDCAGDYGNDGCGGGLPINALKYIKDAGGLEAEDDYKYHCAVSSDCAHDKCLFNANKVAVSVKRFGTVKQGSEAAMKKALATYGPISIALDAEASLQHYTGGIYKAKDCSSDPNAADHAILAVGYGVDKETGEAYAIVKNSWGEEWGEGGYARIALGHNVCGWANYGVWAQA